MRLEAGRRWARAVFTLDPRSLALFRILLALLVLVDLAQRSGDLSAFLTDRGVLPRGSSVKTARAQRRPASGSISRRRA